MRAAALIALMSLSSNAVANEKFEFHGYLSQGLVLDDDSGFITDESGVSFELTEVALNATYQISDVLRVAGQGVYLNGGNRYEEGGRIDYLLLDWNVYSSENWNNSVYLGRVKNYHRLHSMGRGIPMIRPTIILPQATYSDALRDIGVSIDGIGFKSLYTSENIGELDFNFSFGTTDVTKEQMQAVVSPFANGDMEHENDVQFSAFWRPFFSPWQLGFAWVDGEFSYDSAEQDIYVDGDLLFQRFMVNVSYEAEFWRFNAEAYQGRVELTDFIAPGFELDTQSEGAYAQVQYDFNSDWKVLARLERSWGNKDDKSGSGFEAIGLPKFLGYLHSQTIGLTYDFAPNWQFKAEHHWFQGTSAIPPVVVPSISNSPNEYWQVSALQLTHWF